MKTQPRIIVAFFFSILVLVLIGVYSYINTKSYKNSSEWVGHTQGVISNVQRMLSDVQDVETAQRGYVITFQKKYLLPYTAAIENIDSDYYKTKVLVKDNPSQEGLLDSIHTLIDAKVNFATSVIAARDAKGFEGAQQMINTDVGQNLMEKIRADIGRFISNEKSFLETRLDHSSDKFTLAIATITGGICIAVLVLLITFYFFLRDHKRMMISEKKAAESELIIKKFLDALPLGIFVMRADGHPFYANEKSKEILGKGIIQGSSVDELTEIYPAYITGTNELFPAKNRPIARALKGENIRTEDMEIIRNGLRVPLRINATAVRDEEGKIEYAIAVFEDITEVKAVEQNLIKARQVAEESVILKETFLANMSHEIRTPMNAIVGFTDLLMKRNLGAQENDYVRTIRTSGENLLRIINDILDVSKMESNMMTFEEHPISVSEVFNSLHMMLSHRAKEKNLDLNFSSDQDIPPIVSGDPTRLTQIIINLVGNAIKFTKEGSVNVHASLLSENKDGYVVNFSVKDTGIGIPKDKLEQIFERFRQAESHTTRSYGGTGLGLSIAKQLVELQGGSITIESVVGLGSVFKFTLPFKKSAGRQKENSGKHDKIDFELLSTLNILVAEDNPVNVKFVQSLFAEYNMHADIAENGRLAVEKVKSGRHDVVLMDIEMPEMNGYEATAAIRYELYSRIPIIAMTAHAMAGEKEKCLQLGMNDYVTKPIDADLLFGKIQAVVIEAKKKEKVKEAETVTDLSFLIKSMKNRKEVIRETIEIFLEQAPEDLAAIHEAIDKGDYLFIKRAAHRMKSTVSIVGASGIEALLQEMETLGASGTGIDKIKELVVPVDEMCKQARVELDIEKLKYI